LFRFDLAGAHSMDVSQLSRDSSLDFIADALERLLQSPPGETDSILRWLYTSSSLLHKGAIDVLTNVNHIARPSIFAIGTGEVSSHAGAGNAGVRVPSPES
jgi:hypothetical protein